MILTSNRSLLLRQGEANLSAFAPALLSQELKSDARRIFMPAYVSPPDIYDAVLAVQRHLLAAKQAHTGRNNWRRSRYLMRTGDRIRRTGARLAMLLSSWDFSRRFSRPEG